MSVWPMVKVGTVIHQIETVDPQKDPARLFEYIDVSSVSAERCEITETQKLLGADAPSRARRKVRAGDVLFATIRPTLKRIAMVPDYLDGQVCSTGYMVLRPTGEIKGRYLFHVLQSAAVMREMESLQRGAAYPAVSDGDIRSLTIPLPPLDEQKRIVAKIDEIAPISERQLGVLATKRQSTHALHRKLLDNVFAARSGIPRKLGEVVTLINGRAYTKDELLSEGKYRVLRVGNFFGKKEWYWSDLELPDNKYCQDGDLLYAWSASFGPQFWRGGKAIFHYHIWRVKPELSVIDPEWLYWWFLWDVEQVKKAEGTGTTMMHVTKSAMERRELVIPSLQIQAKEAARLYESQRLRHQLDQILDSQEEQSRRFKEALFPAIHAGAA